jgi:hypothetical protein
MGPWEWSITANEELEKLWNDAIVTCGNMLLHSLLETPEGHSSMSTDGWPQNI